jgi:hypothetical protein
MKSVPPRGSVWLAESGIDHDPQREPHVPRGGTDFLFEAYDAS